MFYEITTFMVPVENFTIKGYADIIGEKWAKKLGIENITLSHLDQNVVKRVLESIFEKKMCMGIIANCEDGQIYHARNFDSDKFVNPLQYIGIFKRGGKELFRTS